MNSTWPKTKTSTARAPHSPVLAFVALIFLDLRRVSSISGATAAMAVVSSDNCCSWHFVQHDRLAHSLLLSFVRPRLIRRAFALLPELWSMDMAPVGCDVCVWWDRSVGVSRSNCWNLFDTASSAPISGSRTFGRPSTRHLRWYSARPCCTDANRMWSNSATPTWLLCPPWLLECTIYVSRLSMDSLKEEQINIEMGVTRESGYYLRPILTWTFFRLTALHHCPYIDEILIEAGICIAQQYSRQLLCVCSFQQLRHGRRVWQPIAIVPSARLVFPYDNGTSHFGTWSIFLGSAL